MYQKLILLLIFSGKCSYSGFSDKSNFKFPLYADHNRKRTNKVSCECRRELNEKLEGFFLFRKIDEYDTNNNKLSKCRITFLVFNNNILITQIVNQ